jgi:hypothetical protein
MTLVLCHAFWAGFATTFWGRTLDTIKSFYPVNDFAMLTQLGGASYFFFKDGYFIVNHVRMGL